MTLLTPIVIGCLSAALTAFVHLLLAPWFEEIRGKRAFRRLADDPMIYPGAEFYRLECEGMHDRLLLEGEIVSIEPGRLVVKGNPPGQGLTAYMTFTGREFEKLHPVMKRQGSAA